MEGWRKCLESLKLEAVTECGGLEEVSGKLEA